jgi:hypothetical protein
MIDPTPNHLELTDLELVAVYDGLQLLASKLLADAGLSIATPLTVVRLVVQLHPHVAAAVERRRVSAQPDSGAMAGQQQAGAIV